MAEESTPETTDEEVLDVETTDVGHDVPPEPDVSHDETPEEDPETFPREYVQKLRTEAADARVRAKRADELAASLFTARVAATGRLADPTDVPVAVELLDDADGLTAAIDSLLAAKPHLASRVPRGNIGQGFAGDESGSVDLAALLRLGA